MTSEEINLYPKQFFLLLNYSALLFTLIIVLLSAHIRLGESGLGCDPWPSCYTLSTFQDTTQGLAIPAGEYLELRALHRLFASLLGISVMIIMLIAVWYRRVISPVLPILMFLVVLFLSILGITTPTRTSPAVTMGNVLGGIALIALIWRQLLALKLTDKAPGPHRLALLLSAILGLQILTGVWASANYTATACPNLLTCDFVADAPANLWDSFDVSRELQLDLQGELIFSGHMKTIQFSHRLVSVALVLVVAVTFYVIRRDYPDLMKPVKIVVTLCLAEFLLGVFNVVTEMPLWSNTLHNLLAVALLLSTIYLTRAVSNSISPGPTN
jgi:cytochrome c oxidase assembly protein subunit 15